MAYVNKKDSSTWRNFDDALIGGFIAPTPDATTQVTSQVAARKLTISKLTKALVQSNNAKTLLLNYVDAKQRRFMILRRRTHTLLGRCKFQE